MARRPYDVKSHPPRAPLSRDRIAAEALALVDESGLDALSMRRLAARLGVEAMALYHHFPAKSDLLDAVAEAVLVELAPGDDAPADPLERIADGARRYRAAALRHPAAFPLLTTRRFGTPRAFDVYEAILADFAALGFDARMSARLFRLVGCFAGGAGLSEIAGRTAVAEGTALARGDADALAGHPLVAAVAPELAVEHLEDVFEFGLAAIIETIRVAPRSGAASAVPT